VNTPKKIFNSSLEAGVRSVTILNEIHPLSIDFESLIKADYIIINSDDFGGPESIHPSTSNRLGALSTRRETVRNGIRLMRKFGMIEIDLKDNGVNYKATANAHPYINLMKCNYSNKLKEYAKWISEEITNNGFNDFDLILSEMYKYE
jgi:hypothetical protein